jgi:ApaG protein
MTPLPLIDVTVASAYVEGQSDPDANRFVFAYTVRITNHEGRPCQLLSRHWVITDGAGDVEEVRGKGVVGQQPRLSAQESFEYTSGAVLKTPVGAMHGEYEFVTDEGESFQVPIPAFSLYVPSAVH